jgi:hypothetical protein
VSLFLGRFLSPALTSFEVIATKFTTNYASYKDGKGRTVNHCGNHKRSLHMSLRDSLKKLKTDWIDILYVHWWDWTTSIEGKSSASSPAASVSLTFSRQNLWILWMPWSSKAKFCISEFPTPRRISFLLPTPMPRRPTRPRSPSTRGDGTSSCVTWSARSSQWLVTGEWRWRRGMPLV